MHRTDSYFILNITLQKPPQRLQSALRRFLRHTILEHSNSTSVGSYPTRRSAKKLCGRGRRKRVKTYRIPHLQTATTAVLQRKTVGGKIRSIGGKIRCILGEIISILVTRITACRSRNQFALQVTAESPFQHPGTGVKMRRPLRA